MPSSDVYLTTGGFREARNLTICSSSQAHFGHPKPRSRTSRATPVLPSGDHSILYASAFRIWSSTPDGSCSNYFAYGSTGDNPSQLILAKVQLYVLADGRTQISMHHTQTRALVVTKDSAYPMAKQTQIFRKQYVRRQCNEFMRLGMQGHSILTSSSDYRVASYAGDRSDSGRLSGHGQKGMFKHTSLNPVPTIRLTCFQKQSTNLITLQGVRVLLPYVVQDYTCERCRKRNASQPHSDSYITRSSSW